MCDLRLAQFLPLTWCISEQRLFHCLSWLLKAVFYPPIFSFPDHSGFRTSFTRLWSSLHIDGHVHFQCLKTVRLSSYLFARATSWMTEIICGLKSPAFKLLLNLACFIRHFYQACRLSFLFCLFLFVIISFPVRQKEKGQGWGRERGREGEGEEQNSSSGWWTQGPMPLGKKTVT